MLNDIYELSKGFKKERLKTKLSMIFRNSKIEDEGGIFVVSTNEEEIIKIAYNENGLYKNYEEIMKILSLISPSNKNILYFLQSVKIFIYEENKLIPFEEFSDKIIAQNNFLSKDKFQIIKLYNPTDVLFYSASDIYSNSELYYKLKKLITIFEKRAFVGNISIKDFILYDNASHFSNLKSIYPYKNGINFFICPDCGNGFLRLDIEYFLKKGERETEYTCSNSLCNKRYKFSEIDSLGEFEDRCMLDFNYSEGYRSLGNTNFSEQTSNNFNKPDNYDQKDKRQDLSQFFPGYNIRKRKR